MLYSDQELVLYGRIQFVRALITYKGTDAESFRQAFEEAVDAYLNGCGEQVKELEKPFMWTFTVRIGHELHQTVAMFAANQDIFLNCSIGKVLNRATTVQNSGDE